MAKIPEFSTLEEAATFWDTHDFEDYREDTEPVTFEVKIPQRGKSLTLQLKPQIYDKIEALATERGVRIESLILLWLQEKVGESA